MKTRPTTALVTLVLASGLARAEDQAQLGIEDRKQSVAALAERIADREARLTELANDILRLDERLDRKVGKVVKRLTSIKDSSKSGYRVSEIKMDAIEGLARTVDRRMSKADRDLMRAEMNRHIRIPDEREGQLEEMLIVDQPKTNPITRDAAHELQEALREAAADMGEDMDTIFLRYADLNRERAKLFDLKQTLAAGQKWIGDYEAKEKE